MNQPIDKRSQRLFMELGTALQLSSEDSKYSVAGELAGMRVGQYLIVRIPEKHMGHFPLARENALMVKYILSDDVFGFKARIIRTLDHPDHLIFLSYPEEVKSCNIRSEKRVDCYLPARMTVNRTDLSCVIVNINRSGCLVRVDNIPELDCCKTHPVGLALPFGQFDTLTLNGEIRSESRRGDDVRMGILFDELDAFSKKVLSTLVPALNL